MHSILSEIHPSMWTSAEVIAVISAVSLILLPAMGVFMVAIIGKLRERVDEVSAKADVIVGHVNSEKTAAEGREINLRNEIRILRQNIVEHIQTAALLAQAVAQAGVTVRAAPAAPQEVIVINPPDAPVPVNLPSEPEKFP